MPDFPSNEPNTNDNVLTVYRYVPAWGLADIGPCVTKTVFFLTLTHTPFVYKQEPLVTLDKNAPCGKLPYIIDTDGTKVADSNKIIEYLSKKHGITMDQDSNPVDRAVAVAFERLMAEHLYGSGIIEPRWRMDEGWVVYIPYIVPNTEITPDLRSALDAFRARILSQFVGQGMGRRDSRDVLEVYKADIDALAAFMGDKKYLLGEKVRNLDACCCDFQGIWSISRRRGRGAGMWRAGDLLTEWEGWALGF